MHEEGRLLWHVLPVIAYLVQRRCVEPRGVSTISGGGPSLDTQELACHTTRVLGCGRTAFIGGASAAGIRADWAEENFTLGALRAGDPGPNHPKPPSWEKP
jgi:hypothetical protein